VCHEEFHHHRADDLPAYLNIFIVGHIMVALTIVVMDMKIFGLWQLVALSTVATVSVAHNKNVQIGRQVIRTVMVKLFMTNIALVLNLQTTGEQFGFTTGWAFATHAFCQSS
ncbi:MAG: DUF983 domain-containing protein, partial [Pseudomonadota bacterium]